ncbi:hypothetical protein A4X06_0g1425 [Tilletia controversa]|uniref:Core-binding (CB) domain-containing protein n=1 Tax=Tilletia controversa TaxID=13291 RepID=A0A8X7MZJ9_9BASI|nr:hypothetical protein A4X06_0g1425 [Tilletia controversa]
MADSYSEDTLKSYGSGLARWHQWCDHRGVPEQLRCPAPAELLEYFILQHAGHFSSVTIGTWLSGLRAWHRIWNQSWPAGDMRRTEPIRYTALHTPSTSRKPALPAVTLEWLSTILSVVKQQARQPRGCGSGGGGICCILGSAAAWGNHMFAEELRSAEEHLPHRSYLCLGVRRDSHCNALAILHQNKPSRSGDACRPNGATSIGRPPTLAPPTSGAQHGLKRRREQPVCLQIWEGRHTDAPQDADVAAPDPSQMRDLSVIDGHSFRIGGCTELLRAENAFDDVRVHGRWSSEA